MPNIETEMSLYDTVRRAHCQDCGNPWWWNYPISYVCTTCAKAHGKSDSECYEPKDGQVKK